MVFVERLYFFQPGCKKAEKHTLLSVINTYPVTTATGLTLNISNDDNSLSLDLTKEVAVFSGLKIKEQFK